MSMIPPYFSIDIFAFPPIMLPREYPANEKMSDVNPMIDMGIIMLSKVFYPTQVKVTPMAKASMLVAIDNDKMSRKFLLFIELFLSTPESFIIFHPMYDSNANAIQWSIVWMKSPKSTVVCHPITGISA